MKHTSHKSTIEQQVVVEQPTWLKRRNWKSPITGNTKHIATALGQMNMKINHTTTNSKSNNKTNNIDALKVVYSMVQHAHHHQTRNIHQQEHTTTRTCTGSIISPPSSPTSSKSPTSSPLPTTNGTLQTKIDTQFLFAQQRIRQEKLELIRM
jgi:hypothetical protein